jgi:hypothetical protein
MPIVQFVPKKVVPNAMWWKKTIFQENNGVEYVLNFPERFVKKSVLENADFLNNLKKDLLDNHLKFMEGQKREVILNHKGDGLYNLEFKFCDKPSVLKLNLHLKVSDDIYIPSFKENTIINNIKDDYFFQVETFIESWENQKGFLASISMDNYHDRGYKISHVSQQALNQQQQLKNVLQELAPPVKPNNGDEKALAETQNQASALTFNPQNKTNLNNSDQQNNEGIKMSTESDVMDINTELVKVSASGKSAVIK